MESQAKIPRSSFRSDSGNLDIIRAVAVMSVFFAHLAGGDSEIAWHFAQMGVLTFFVHTSMVLMLSLERTPLVGGSLFGSFYLRRFFRIYPLSAFCVTVAMLFHGNPTGPQPVNWTLPQYVSNLTLVTNLTYSENMVGGLWTLPLEVQMYICLPFLFVLGRSQGLRTLTIIWALTVLAGYVQPSVSGRLNVISYAPCFVAGVIGWKLSLRVQRTLPGWLWPIAFVATWPIFFAAKHDNVQPFRWAFCLALGLLIPWFREVNWEPLTRPAQVVAKYSYGIYLSHVALIIWAFGLPLERTGQWLAFWAAAVATPVVMFHWIESPLIRIGQRLGSWLFPTGASCHQADPCLVIPAPGLVAAAEDRVTTL